jgi:Mg-dependent DNase
MEFLKIKACCVSMNVINSLETLSLSKQSDLVLPFIGIHPEYANDDLEKITNLIELNQNNISGIGEIGLDPTYVNNNDDTNRQIQVFESLLSSAEKFHKPVSIHSRKSLDDVFEIMTSYDTRHALLHWFDGSKKQLQKAMDMDFLYLLDL